MRHPAVPASHAARGSAAIDPRLTPAWFRALPMARSAGASSVPMAMPAAGIPAASEAPNTARHATRPPNPRVKPVAMPAQDHSPTARLMARFKPARSMNIPANGALAA